MQRFNPQYPHFSPQMQKNNSQTSDSPSKTTPVGMEETSSDWEFDGLTLFRALGYVVGLLSFIVGTALFMLGFSLANLTLIQVASGLYSLAAISLLGRIVVFRLKPKNESQAALLAVVMLCSGGIIYTGLMLLFSIAHLI